MTSSRMNDVARQHGKCAEIYVASSFPNVIFAFITIMMIKLKRECSRCVSGINQLKLN